MKVIFSTLILIFLISCGGAPTKKRERKSYDDLSDVKSYEKKKVVTARYNKASDKYSLGPEATHALISEALSLVPEKYASRMSSSDDPISEIIGNCYRKKYDKAFEKADEYYDSYKGNPAYWNQIGSCYLLKGENKKAQIYYNKARSFNAKYVPAINNLGVLQQKFGNYKLAVSQFKKAMRLNYSAKTPRFNLANIYLKYGLTRKACPIFNALTTGASKDPDALNGAAVCHLLKGQYSQAQAKYKQMSKSFRKRPYIGINYAIALKLTGQKSDAIDILEDIENTKSKSLNNYIRRVKNFINRGGR